MAHRRLIWQVFAPFVAVTAGGPDGRVFVVDTASRKVLTTIPVGHTPLSPVVTADGLTLFVCNRFNNSISVVDTHSGTETGRISVVREPVAAAVTPDDRYLLVANHLPAGPSSAEVVAAQVSVIDVAQRRRVADIDLPNGSTGLRGICVSPDGRYAYVTHILARYQEPTTQLDRGWMNTNALSILDVAGLRRLNTVLLDDVDHGAANPWAVACTEDGRRVCVTHAGETFDTPTLVNVWRTGPYLVNGQAATIKEVLTTFNPHDQHGATSSMTGQDINDLAEYVLSL